MENATAGLSSQIKGRAALFSCCFDKKIADCSQFLCLCPLLVPEAAEEQQVLGSYLARSSKECTKLETEELGLQCLCFSVTTTVV